jgi:galactokinase
MMGGGFGGYLLVLVKASFSFDEALPPLFAAYEKRYGLAAESIEVKLNNGVSSVYLT